MKSAPIPRNQSSFEILELFGIWRYQSLVILFFSSVVILIYDESVGVCLCIAEQFSFRRNVT